jgi:hypothetical protein
MAHEILRARVGAIRSALAGLSPARVVRERIVHFLGHRMQGDPLGSVHVRRTGQISGAPRVDDDVGLGGEAAVRGEAVPSLGQLDPLAAPVLAELGGVERAVVEDVPVDIGAGARRERASAHELQDS